MPILVLSARGAVGDRILGLSEGADDYLPKPFSPAELVVRVRTILRRTERRATACHAGTTLALATSGRTAARHGVTVGGEEVVLSALELRLLGALLEADGRVLTRDQLLDAIHGEGEGDVTDRAIDQYVKRLREKLGDDPAEPRYVATVRGAGYRAAGPVERRTPPGEAGTRPVSERPSGDRIWVRFLAASLLVAAVVLASSRSGCSGSGRPRSRR